MEPPLDQMFSSSHYQETHLDLERPPATPNNFNSNTLELNMSSPFMNDRQTCNKSSRFDFNNRVPTPFIDDSQLSTHESSSQCEINKTTQPDGFQQQFKLENDSKYAHSHENIGEGLLCPKPQVNVPGDFSLFPVSQNIDSYESSPYVNEIQKNQSINISQFDLLCSQNQSAISAPGILQLDPISNGPGHQSPNFSHIHFNSSPNNTSSPSLGPSSIGLFPTGTQDWNLCQPQFVRHRRTPSEYSDVSATSAQHSPNILHQFNLEQQNSPMQNAQDSSLYQEVLTFGEFSISDPQAQNVQSTRSPARSPAMSPQIDSQHVIQENSLIGVSKDSFCHVQSPFPQEPFPTLNSDTGQANQMIPPEINVEFAPMSRQNTFESSSVTKFDKDALTPPDKSRRRAFTDTTSSNINVCALSHSSLCISPQQSSTISAGIPNQQRSLSPHNGARVSSSIRLRRQSTPSIPNRDHNLSLANPEYKNLVLESGNLKRAQKHPATFQCTLCPKKFTRAYNLRSHLRTHTDERPFTCTVCGKAFARQHDRKRHEGLHSGEKKFICKGELKEGGQWGCGRRFARADALGRHFRSEAGRVCINLLLDEEARGRQRAWYEKQMQDMQKAQSHSMLPADVGSLPNNFILPAALLAQYPALATVSWCDLPQGDAGIEDEPSGRSSFEASGSEYYDDVDERNYN